MTKARTRNGAVCPSTKSCQSSRRRYKLELNAPSRDRLWGCSRCGVLRPFSGVCAQREEAESGWDSDLPRMPSGLAVHGSSNTGLETHQLFDTSLNIHDFHISSMKKKEFTFEWVIPHCCTSDMADPHRAHSLVLSSNFSTASFWILFARIPAEQCSVIPVNEPDGAKIDSEQLVVQVMKLCNAGKEVESAHIKFNPRRCEIHMSH